MLAHGDVVDPRCPPPRLKRAVCTMDFVVIIWLLVDSHGFKSPQVFGRLQPPHLVVSLLWVCEISTFGFVRLDVVLIPRGCLDTVFV